MSACREIHDVHRVDPVFRTRHSRKIWSSVFNTVLVTCEKTDSQHDILLKCDFLIKIKTNFLSMLTDVQRKTYRRLLYTWVRASWIEFINCPTRCNLFSLLHFCRQLYMFPVLTPTIRSSYNCSYSLWYWLTGSTTIRSRWWVGTDSCESYDRYLHI